MSHNLVDVMEAVPGVILDIRYATANNFTGRVLYDEARCFLQETTAEKLRRVVNFFAVNFRMGVKVFDGYRPLSVQRKLWQIVPDERYVADPEKGSKHNRGTAVDVTLVSLSDGKEVDMGTAYDDFTDRAHFNHLDGLSEEVLNNRVALRQVMMGCGFLPILTEWWHFDDSDWDKYPLLDLDFSTL